MELCLWPTLSPERANANVVSWEDMESHLASFDLSMDQIPIVLQCNKQDVLGALTPAAIKYLLHTYSIPTSIAVATHGEGVFDTLKMITLNVISSIQKQMVVA